MKPATRRSRDNFLYVSSLGPREMEALRLIADEPGITVAELQDALGVSRSRVWQIVNSLERPRVRVDAHQDQRWYRERAR